MINPRTPFARPRSSVGRRPPQGSARAKTPVLTVEPIVPVPDAIAVPSYGRIRQLPDGRVVAQDASGNLVARAATLGGHQPWHWVGSDKAAGLDYFLRELADGAGITLGVAPDGAQFDNHDPTYLTLLGEYFNQDLLSIAWSDLNPSPNEFTFDWLDRLLKYATEHRMATLSTLIWSGGTPQWLKAGNFTKAQLMTIAEKYVTTVMTPWGTRTRSGSPAEVVAG